MEQMKNAYRRFTSNEMTRSRPKLVNEANISIVILDMTWFFWRITYAINVSLKIKLRLQLYVKSRAIYSF